MTKLTELQHKPKPYSSPFQPLAQHVLCQVQTHKYSVCSSQASGYSADVPDSHILLKTTSLEKPNSHETSQLHTDVIRDNQVLRQRAKSIDATNETDGTSSIK